MNISEFDPAEKGDNFWGPYLEYQETAFESRLTTHFQEMYPEGNGMNNPQSQHVPAAGPGKGRNSEESLNAEAKMPAAGRQEMVSKLVLAVLSIGLVVMLYFLGRYCYSPKVNKAQSEAAPLLAKV